MSETTLADMSVTAAKRLCWNLWANPVGAALADDVEFYGPAPIGRLEGRDALLAHLYAPLGRSFENLTSEPYLFLGGSFEGNIWVATTGNLTGKFIEPWCGIPPTGQRCHLRFGEFYRVDDERIVEIRLLFDVLALAADAGYELLPPFPASAIPPPGPAEIDGICLGDTDPAQSAATLQLVEDMLGGCNRLVDGELRSMGMDAYWHSDMVWYGPWGVGTTHGFDQFQNWAQGPSVRSFPNRRGGFHQARFADGQVSAFTGWPSLQGTFDGEPFRGIGPTGARIGQNIMDFHVRRGDLLHENWVLIDLIDFAAQCGVDLLARLPS